MMSVAFYLQAIRLALSQIRANLGRSLLTALGIIVGVASVTSRCGPLASRASRLAYGVHRPEQFRSAAAAYAWCSSAVSASSVA